ncbi:MAG: hypothetical protein IJ139_10425, partial [Bacteroidaceae bacterium]|nr:hypothetical protein [Bacteroidaceae bacterium]
SQANFENLESLNLNLNYIKDEGLLHMSYGFYPKLSYLYLFYNKITSEGITTEPV